MHKPDLVDALEELLDAERDLVLAGEILKLEHLAGQKESLLAHLAGARPDSASLTRIRQDLDRNARILTAAGQGIRHALERVRDLADPAPLATYDGHGRRSEIEAPEPSVSRSA